MKHALNSPYRYSISIVEKQVSYSVKPVKPVNTISSNDLSRGVAAGMAAIILVSPAMTAGASIHNQTSINHVSYSISQVDLDDYSYKTPYKSVVVVKATQVIETKNTIKAPNISEYDIWS